MAALLAEDRVFTIVDPLQHDGFETSRGYLEPGEGGYIRTRDPELAREIKQREPHALIAEHEVEAGGQALRGQSLLVVNKTWESQPNNEHWKDLGNGRWKYIEAPKG